MDIDSQAGRGTRVTVTSPPEPASVVVKPSRDDEPLNLVGALEDLRDLGLAHVALDAVVAGVADAAEHLNGVGGHLHRGVGGDQLGDTGLRRIRPAQVASARGVEIRRACTGHRGGHVGQHEPQALMVDDLAAERGSLVGVGGGLVQRGLRQPDGDGGDAQPAGIQCAEGDLQALALLADAAGRRRRGRGRRTPTWWGSACRPIFSSGLPKLRPARSPGMRKQEMPREPSPVRANSV